MPRKGSLRVLFAVFSVALLLASAHGETVIRVDGRVPVISPVEAIDQASISISTTFPNGSIFYTLDGSAPTAANSRYTAPFVITSTKTIRAIAYSVDFGQSELSSAIEVRIVPGVRLTLTSQTATAGSISVLPASPSSGKYASNSYVQLTATPSSGWRFIGWEGSITGQINPYNLQLDGNKAVTALFGTTVNIIQPANGRIHAATDPANAVVGRTIALTAIPDAGYYFGVWGGDGIGTTQHYAFRVTKQNPTISALFIPLPEPVTNRSTLTVYTDDGEGGTVRITHRDNLDAALPYYTGPDGRLAQAIANPGWTFTGWTGDIVSRDNPAAVRLDTSKVVVGHFARGFSLIVNKQDGGTVSVTPDQPAYPANTVVELLAQPETGFTFAGWASTAGLRTENPLTITMTSNITLSAYFNAPERAPLWSFPLGQPILRMAADKQGNVLALSANALTKIAPNGTEAWTVGFSPRPSYVSNRDLAIDSDGNARVTFFGGGGEFQFYSGGMAIVRPDGSTNLYSTYPGSADISIGRDGTIYSASEYTRQYQGFYQAASEFDAFTPTGAHKWAFSESYTNPNDNFPLYYNRFSRGAVGVDNRVYFSGVGGWNATNALYCVDASGNLLWKFPRLLPALPRTAPILAGNSIYTTDEFGWILSLNRAGGRNWRFHTAEQSRLPSVGADGVIYFGGIDAGRFYSVNPDRTVNWERTPGRGGYSIPAIGSDGTIYFTDPSGLNALDKDGNRLWMAATGGLGNLILVSNRVYTATGNQIHAVAANAVGPANSPWPMAEASPAADAQEQIVLLPPEFELKAMQFAAAGFEIEVRGRPGSTLRLYHSTDLETWTLIHSETTQTGVVRFVDPPSAATANFYRVSEE